MRKLGALISLAVLGLIFVPTSALAGNETYRSWPAERRVFATDPDPWRYWGHDRRPEGHHFRQAPVVVVPQYAVWVEPYWTWNGYQWVWVPGHWVW